MSKRVLTLPDGSQARWVWPDGAHASLQDTSDGTVYATIERSPISGAWTWRVGGVELGTEKAGINPHVTARKEAERAVGATEEEL